MSTQPTISERLREAILNAPENRSRISRATGVSEGVLSRFVNFECGITMNTADLLAAYLKLDLMPIARRPAAQRKGR